MSEDAKLLDEALLVAAFSSHAVPGLSEDFERRVQQEIDEAAGRRARSSARSSFMLYYWIFVCLMSLALFAFFGIAGFEAMSLILASIGFCFLVATILLNFAGLSLADLILGSISRSKDLA